MADFQAAMIQRLLADGAVQAIVGSKANWVVTGQSVAPPYLRLQDIGGLLSQHLKGYDGMQVARVQADCFGVTHRQSNQLAVAVITAIAAPTQVEGVKFGRGRADGRPRDLGEDVPGKGFIHRASVDLLVAYRLA
ncbi:DUF3168 domain-containing protein [uncultured Novosphingobium sp.]|uniref:tail completion protein gp17 n=1 Tax=uncultured Novosphingobium sp. TaxID=292277 RepID=UPI00258B842A|nr:DUF3168 domain-containing protein [uncultured Novosphingobium sp.]